jgi:uncharacterized protein (TIGR03067 family)
MNTALLLGLAVGVSAPALKDPPKKDAAIVGEWVPESVAIGRKKAQHTVTPAGLTYLFTGDGKWVTQREDDLAKFAPPRDYKLDPKTNPPSIDVTGGPAAAKPLVGIYMVEGDTLTICFAGPGDEERPKSFEPPEGSRFMKMVLKRAKKKE